ncbi:hypothetical protein PR048_014557 [Dryococelus australis]|uniref:Tc3 transposase DNA binding domain-containing protein n=1 Tax=Dryococelus australis TaxID=614101 RepID=A0ABQ9HER7_9NEOP|nr:hypothetical protein PR048_014557 [Dryococelus australis]
MPPVGGFSRESPISPAPVLLHTHLTSTLIGSPAVQMSPLLPTGPRRRSVNNTPGRWRLCRRCYNECCRYAINVAGVADTNGRPSASPYFAPLSRAVERIRARSRLPPPLRGRCSQVSSAERLSLRHHHGLADSAALDAPIQCETATYTANSSCTRQEDGVTGHPYAGTPFDSYRLFTPLASGNLLASAANSEHSVVCSSQSDTSRVPRGFHSQSKNGYSYIKGTATPVRVCLYFVCSVVTARPGEVAIAAPVNLRQSVRRIRRGKVNRFANKQRACAGKFCAIHQMRDHRTTAVSELADFVDKMITRTGSYSRRDQPRFSHVEIVPDDGAGRRVFSGTLRFPGSRIQALLHIQLVSPSSALNASLTMGRTSGGNHRCSGARGGRAECTIWRAARSLDVTRPGVGPWLDVTPSLGGGERLAGVVAQAYPFSDRLCEALGTGLVSGWLLRAASTLPCVDWRTYCLARPEEFASSMTCRLDSRVLCTDMPILTAQHWLSAITVEGDNWARVLQEVSNTTLSRRSCMRDEGEVAARGARSVRSDACCSQVQPPLPRAPHTGAEGSGQRHLVISFRLLGGRDITLASTSVDLCGRHTLQAGVEPVDKEMARGTELSDFDKGVIMGCHLSGLSNRAIARKVNRPISTVAFVLRKWKADGHCANAARSGRPPISTGRNRRTLKREIFKNRAQPMPTIRQEFHAATGVSVSIGTLRIEAHRLGYFGRAAAHKPHIRTSYKAQRLRWCLDRRNLTLEQ